MIEGFLPVEYFSELVGIMTDCSILIQIVKEVLPEIYNHLHSFNFDLSLNNLLYNWLVSLFVQNMKKEVWMPIWDILFIDGNITIFKAAIFILTFAKDLILKQTNMIEINQFFEEEFKNFLDERLIDYLISKPFYYSMEQINELRKIQMPKVEQNIKQTSDYKRNRYKDQKLICNLDWPICLNNFTNINIEHVSVLKRAILPNITHDFYSFHNDVYSIVKAKEKANEKFKKKTLEESTFKYKVNIFQNLIVERHQHNCKSNKSIINEIELVKKSNSISNFFSAFCQSSSKNTLLFEDRRSLYCSNIIAEVEKSLTEDKISLKEKEEEKNNNNDKMNTSEEIITFSKRHNSYDIESPKENECII